MHELYELKEKLMRELEDYSKNGKFSKEDVEAIKYITSAIDHICNIMEDADEEGYSGGMMRMSGRSYTDGGRAGRGNRSYARGRGGNARRDSRGRYSSEGYSYEFKADLEELMQDAPNERVKMKLREVMQEV